MGGRRGKGARRPPTGRKSERSAARAKYGMRATRATIVSRHSQPLRYSTTSSVTAQAISAVPRPPGRGAGAFSPCNRGHKELAEAALEHTQIG